MYNIVLPEIPEKRPEKKAKKVPYTALTVKVPPEVKKKYQKLVEERPGMAAWLRDVITGVVAKIE